MSQGVALDNIGDYADHILPYFMHRGEFQFALKKQNYNFTGELCQAARLRAKAGNKVEWRAIYRKSAAAQFIRPFQVTPNPYINVFTKGSAPWVHMETKATFNQIIASDSQSPADLVDYVRGEHFVALEAAVELMEDTGVDVPWNSNDDKAPYGLPYWFPPLDTGTTDYEGAFGGKTATWGDGTTTTTIGGIDRSTYDLARNWAVNHRGHVDMNFCRALRRAMEYTGFKEPADLQEFIRMSAGDSWMFFTPMDFKLQYEDLVNSGPDDRNGDLNPFKGSSLTYRGMRWRSMTALNDSTLQSCFGINLAHFFCVVRRGWWKRIGRAQQLEDRHTFVKGYDWRFQHVCDNPRKGGFHIHKKW